MNIVEQITKAADQRERIREAAAEEVGRIIHEARKTDDPVKLVALKKELASTDPDASLSALLLTADMVAGTKGSAKELAAAKSAVVNLDAEIAKQKHARDVAVAEANKAISATVEQRADKAADVAGATVADARYRAISTGIADPGFGSFTNSGLRAWARLAKLI